MVGVLVLSKTCCGFSKERENMLCVVSGLEVGGVSFIVQCVFSVNGD